MNEFSKVKSFEAIVSTAIDGIVVCDSNNIIRYFNPGAERLLGWSAGEVVGRDMGMIIPPKYREMHRKGMQRYVETGIAKVLGTPFVHLPSLHRNGHEIATNISIATWHENGNIFFTGIIRDVSETKAHEERQNLLIQELNHRVKNTISIIQGIVNQASKYEKDVDEFRKDIEDRLVSLAGTHDLLVEANWSHTTIKELVEKFLKPYDK